MFQYLVEVLPRKVEVIITRHLDRMFAHMGLIVKCPQTFGHSSVQLHFIKLYICSGITLISSMYVSTYSLVTLNT